MNEENVNAEINFDTGSIETGNTGGIGSVPEHDGGFGVSGYGESGTSGNNVESGVSGSSEGFGMPVGGTETVGSEGGNSNYSDASKPAKIGVWTKFKNLFVSVENRPVSDSKFVNFWMQEVTFDKVYDFLFQEIKFK